MKILNTRILKKGVITLSFLCYLITCGFVPYYYDEATNLCYGDGFFDLFFGWFCFIFPEIFTKIYSLAWFSNITYIVAIRHLIKGNRKHFVLWICITIILSSLLIICPKTETDTWGNIHHFTLTIGYYLRIISFFILFVGGIFVILKMNINMSIQFPILNISLSNLSSQDLEETHIGDLWDYPGDNSIFEEYYNNQKYVDQSGHIFKIIGKRKSNFINSIIHFNKKELIFEDCGETICFSVLKDFLINRYNSLDDNLAKSVLIRLTKQSKNIKDLIW